MHAKNALRVMNRFGIVEMRQMNRGRNFYYLPGSLWSVSFTEDDNGQAVDFRVYLGGTDSFMTKKNLNEALRSAFERSKTVVFTYLDQELTCRFVLHYEGAYLRPTGIVGVELPLTGGRQTRQLRHIIETIHPQGIIMLKEVLDGADPGPLLDWLQDQGGPEIERLIASLVSPRGE